MLFPFINPAHSHETKTGNQYPVFKKPLSIPFQKTRSLFQFFSFLFSFKNRSLKRERVCWWMDPHSRICGDSTALCHLTVIDTRLVLLSSIFVPICMLFFIPSFPFHIAVADSVILYPFKGQFRRKQI